MDITTRVITVTDERSSVRPPAQGGIPLADTSSPPRPGRIPTASAVDHLGYNVPDLDRAIAFFTDFLGFTLLERSGGFAQGQPTPAARVAMLEFGGTRVELLQFHPTATDAPQPGLQDHGGYHLALTIDDLDAAVAYLRTNPEVRLVREPDQLQNGHRRVFFLTPWGATIQLITPRAGTIF
jgi:catechol 2,3-dioxygenase-like lactoylglutathione lyase family enzyme